MSLPLILKIIIPCQYQKWRIFLTQYKLIKTSIDDYNSIFQLIICFVVSLFFLLSIPNTTHAEPWFTGPLLAPSGRIVPLGHMNLEWYGNYTKNTGFFNQHWKSVHARGSDNQQLNPILNYGLSPTVDVGVNIPYVINHGISHTGQHIGDVALFMGKQLSTQQSSFWSNDWRLLIEEVFPTGRYRDLDPANGGADGTGIGSYQTIIGFIFQHLYTLNNHYLRNRLSFNYLYASKVDVSGHSAYGGNASTKGVIHPGNLTSVDFSSELTLTKHWVAVMEGYYFYRQPSSFIGRSGEDNHGLGLTIGHPAMAEITLAPAIEYNFSAHYGIIAGSWFSIAGKDTARFVSAVIAFNAFW